MNKNGFISTSIVYSFFLVFIAIIISIIAGYYSRRMMIMNIKNDIRGQIDSRTNYNCFSKGITKLNDCIIDTYGGKEKLELQDNPDFRVVSTEDDYGLYVAEDDLGKSYYFRGNVKDNYVIFGQDNQTEEDFYWRIVRINGDGTIRLAFDGKVLTANGVETDSKVAYDFYNNSSNNYKYVGYTYDDGTGTQVDSLIKSKLDEWYETNLLDYYGDYIADGIFCNDRSLKPGSSTEFAAMGRIASLENATLKCTNKSDRYTVADTTNGNGLLKYPIATLTADEIVHAGADTSSNNDYLYLTRTGIWTMTPSYFASYPNKAVVWMFSSAGNLSHYYGEINLIYFTDKIALGYRPVINLKADTIIKKGNGTISNPYVLEEVNY